MADRRDSTTEGSRGVRRLATRPILEAGAIPGYGPLFNAGLVHHEGRYHLFVRAVRDGYRVGEAGGPRFVDYVSDIVVFTSIDGLEYEFGYVLASRKRACASRTPACSGCETTPAITSS